jgi:hypothetical protein
LVALCGEEASLKGSRSSLRYLSAANAAARCCHQTATYNIEEGGEEDNSTHTHNPFPYSQYSQIKLALYCPVA